MTKGGNTVIYRRIEIVKNVIAELTNYLIIIAVGYMFQSNFTEDMVDKRIYFPLAVLPLFYYFLREKCKVFSLFFLFHFLPVVLIFLGYHASPAQEVFAVLIAAACMVISFIRRLDNGNRAGADVFMPPAAIAILIILYTVDVWQGKGSSSNFLRQMTILYALGFFLFYFLKQFLHYMDMNDRTTDHIPLQHIFYSAAGLTGGFTLISAIVIALTSDWTLIDRIGQFVRNAFSRLLGVLFSLFPEGREYVVETTPEVEMEDMVWSMEQTLEESELFQVMDKVVSVFAVIFTSVLFIMAVVGAVKLIKAAFAGRWKKRSISEGIFLDQVEDLKPAETQKEKEKRSLLQRIREPFSPEEKIRRVYRKTMSGRVNSWEGEKKAAVLKKGTARECCMQFFPKAANEAKELAVLYEKARYGNGLCGQEDVRRARLLAEKLSQEG